MKKIIWITITGVTLVSLVTMREFLWRGGSSFWGNFLVNVVAGFVCAGVLTIIGIKIAENKLKDVIAVIQRLRKEKAIDPKTARAAVACAVVAISPDFLRQVRGSTSNEEAPQDCDVCAQKVKTAGALKHCYFCGLSGNYWKLPISDQRILEE